MVQTIVSGVVQEIRSSALQVNSTLESSPKPIQAPITALISDECNVSKNVTDINTRRDAMKGPPGRSRSASPTKRKSVCQHRLQDEFSLYDAGNSGDGLAVLLKACEILDKDHQKELETPQSDLTYSVNPRKTPRSPAKSPRKGIRSSSPSKTRPQGPCTNPHCMNPSESPQWRRGPSEAPVLCNACGTRWIRNKSLVPIVPQRGIRYNKLGNKNVKKSHIKEEGDSILLQEDLAPDVKNSSKLNSNGATEPGQKKTVFTLVASVPSQHSFQPPQSS